MTGRDAATTNPGHYTVVFENDEVRVLEYRDRPGDRTTPHEHPDTVVYSLSPFRRRLRSGGLERDVELPAGRVSWLPAQEHSGENIGDTETHLLFVELKVGSHERLPPEHDRLPEVELGPHGV